VQKLFASVEMFWSFNTQHVSEVIVRERKLDGSAVMKSNFVFCVCLARTTPTMFDMFPGHVETVNRLRRKILQQIDVLSSHSGSDIQQLAVGVEAEQPAHPVHQVLCSLDVVGVAIFPKTEIQIPNVPADVVFHAAGVKVLDFAFMRICAPMLSLDF